ncbi:hypothetical protein AB0L34_02465 [Micromonospora sp. NPDC052213]|uniref:hypothetical protein n=1 Tax=Micromonospora sp. NPDC052213 TaxID=3155812 RepID=UPI00343AC9CB
MDVLSGPRRRATDRPLDKWRQQTRTTQRDRRRQLAIYSVIAVRAGLAAGLAWIVARRPGQVSGCCSRQAALDQLRNMSGDLARLSDALQGAQRWSVSRRATPGLMSCPAAAMATFGQAEPALATATRPYPGTRPGQMKITAKLPRQAMIKEAQHAVDTHHIPAGAG